MTTSQVDSSEAYFREVLKPNYDAFFGRTSTFASAFNLSTSLFHFHEWLYDEFRPDLETRLGATFQRKGDFWGAVQATNSNFGYIRDVTNSSKHVQLTQRPSTGMTHAANTHIISTGYGGGGYGRGRFGDSRQVVMSDGGQMVSFDTCATELYVYWKALLEALIGHPLT